MAKIGNVEFALPLLLAPMAGVTDSAFRTICREMGAAGACTEMVSAKALTYNDKKTKTLLDISPEEHPCAVQIFGSEPEICSEAAVRALEISGADYIDINMGCPMPKITNNGEGSELMKNIPLAAQVITAVRKSIKTPLTVKFRAGIDENLLNAAEFAKMAESCGADAICVHGRTQKQVYSGKSDFGAVMAAKNAVKIPVIASGDMFCGADAANALAAGIDFVTVARGAQGNPFVFRQMACTIRGEAAPRSPDLHERLGVMLRHIALMCERKTENRAMAEARKHMLWYLRGVVGAKPYKLLLAQVRTYAQAVDICNEMENEL